jgi:hypothetical protein
MYQSTVLPKRLSLSWISAEYLDWLEVKKQYVSSKFPNLSFNGKLTCEGVVKRL